MKNARDNRQTQVKNCLKWTASGLLLALMFVLVFAGTLSGAFGIENELQQNGIIQSNVASAAGNSASTNSNSITANNLDYLSALKKTDYVNNWSTGKTFTIDNLVQSNLAYTLYWWNNELAFSNASVAPEANGSSFIMSTNKTSDRNYEDRCQRLITYLSIQLPTPLINLISNGSCVVTAKATFTYTKDDDQFVSMTVIEGAERLTVYSSERRESGNDTVTHNSWLDTGQSAEMEKSKTLSSNTKFITLAFYSRVRTNWARSIGLKWSDISLKFQSAVATDTDAPGINQSGLGQNKFIFSDQNSGLYQIYSKYNNGTYTEITSSCSLTVDKKNGNILYQTIGLYDFLAIDNYGNIKEESYYVAYDANDKELNIKNRTDFDGFSLIISNKKTNFANRTFKIVPDANDPNQNITKYGLVAGTYIDMLATNYTPGGYYDYGAGLAGSFQGTLDGNGCSIINLNIKLASNQARAGLIGTLDGNGCIKNLTIRSGSIDTTDRNDAGAFVGYLNSANARIENCVNYASVGGDGNNAEQVGGICSNIGSKGGTITGCKNYGTVKGKAIVGGIVGFVQGAAKVEHCYNQGDVTSTATSTKTDVYSSAGGYVGGIVGISYGSVRYCFSKGNVTSHSGGFAAGIAAAIHANATTEYCYTMAIVGGNGTTTGIGKVVGHTFKEGQSAASNTSTCWGFFDNLPNNGDNIGSVADGKYTRGLAAITTNDLSTIKPQVIGGGVVTEYEWENITLQSINGFELSFNVSKGFFIEAKQVYRDVSGNKKYSETVFDGATITSDIVNGTLSISMVFEASFYGSSVAYYDSANTQPLMGFSAQEKSIDEENIIQPQNPIGRQQNNDYKNTTIYGQNAIATYTTKNSNGYALIKVYAVSSLDAELGAASDVNYKAGYSDKNYTLTTATFDVGNYFYLVEFLAGDGNTLLGYAVIEHTIEQQRITVQNTWTGYSEGTQTNVYEFIYNGKHQGIIDNGIAIVSELGNFTFSTNDYTIGSYVATVNASDDNYSRVFTLLDTNNFVIYSQESFVGTIKLANTYGVSKNDNVVTYTWSIAQKQITIGQSSFYYGTNIEQKLTDGTVFQNLVSGHSVVVNIDYNFYERNISSNNYPIEVGNIVVNDGSGQPVTGNYTVQSVTITVLAGDFWSDGTTDIANNPWGNQNNPYVIGTKDQLTRLSAIVGGTSAVNSIKNDTYVYVQAQSGNYSNAYFKLADNIPSVGNITPIGSNTHSFAGNFDGNNKAISGLNISVAGNNVGLFGYISGATIKYLTVNGSVKGSQYVGGVVGYALNSTIENVTNNASVSSTYKDAPYEIKQFDAHPNDTTNQAVSKVNDGDLESKYYSAKKGAMSFIVQNTTLAYIFGFAITNANDTNNSAEIQKRTPQSAIIWGSNNDFQRENYTSGGGNTTVPIEWGWEEVYNSTLAMPSTNSYRKEFFSGFKLRNYKYYYIYVKAADNYSTLQFAEFDLLTTNSQNVGGVVGYAQGTSINKATNTASVEGDTRVGGIVGYSDSTSRMYGTIVNSGNITANSMVGGVSGENHGFWCDTNSNYGTFKNSGSINGRNGATVGGVTAFADKEMRNAENTGKVIGGNAVGGVAGRVQAPIKNSYNSGKIVGTNPTAQGEISGTPNGVFVGGITGYTTDNGTISNCYNTGNIAAHSASGDYINNGDYVGGIVGFAQAKVEYCANIGGLIEGNGLIDGNNFIGGIVGSALNNTNIDYCYDVQGQRQFRWSGCNHGAITGSGGNVTNSWAINEKPLESWNNTADQTSASTKKRVLTTDFEVDPQRIDGTNYVDKVWTDILDTNINGFKVVGNVASGTFFVSDNGKSGDNLRYVQPTKTTGFGENNSGNVTAWYSANITSDINVHITDITVGTSEATYDGNVHGFGFTTNPDKAVNDKNVVYGVDIVYVGKNSSDTTPTEVDVYDVTITVKIGDQVVGKTTKTYTVKKREINITWQWTQYVNGNNTDLNVTFEYNTLEQGIESIDLVYPKLFDVTGNSKKQVVAGNYSRTYTLNDTRNNIIKNNNGTSITFSWTINQYNLTNNVGNVWFGGRTDLIVGNQGIANVEVGNQSYADKRFYPLQSKETGVQKVLVYAQHNYTADKFVLYVKYNNGTVAVLTQGTEYTVGTLDTNNTFGTFVNVVSQADPVVDTNVTASGTGNFSGNITKYYTAMFSDFGWKKDKSPSDEDWGSQDNPYVISKPEHLLRLSQIVNGGMAWNSIQNTVTAGVCIAPQTTAKATSRDYKDAYFLVTVDIDMSGYISTDGVYNFLPIGTRSTQNQTELPFSATFDGGDNTITYVYNVGSFYNVDGARTNYVGLFGYLNGATISNLKVASNGGLSITDNRGIVGIEYVGGIAGYAVDSTLYNSVLAYGGWVRGENYVGGIVGYGERITIVSSEAVSSANVGGKTYVGGIVGKWIVSNQSQIGGSVAGQRYITPADQTDVMGIKYVGGIAGWMDTSSCATTISYAPQLNNNGKEGNLIVVGGIEYVGALFGAFIGNGYHQNATNDKYTAIVIDKDASDKFNKVGNVKVLLQNLNETASGNAKVVGGLVGYAEGVGILFNTDWTTSNVTLDTGNYTPSFIGGIAGVLGKNATIEAIYQLKNDGTFLTGGTHTITHSVPNKQTFGTAAKPLGSFVGGIVGYVSSQAGVYWETGTTIFGNGISLVNSATIYATSYAGGIFGALGDLSTSVAQTFENDTDSILYKVLTTGVREGSASTTLGLAPTVSGNGITAQGRLVNNASISVSGSYVGGIAGYGGAKVRFVLRNTPQDSAIDVSKLNIYSGGSDIFINGSYAGGIAGYLVDNLEHDLQYIVVKARFNTNNQSATRVGGLVGYMGSGNVQNCVVTNGGSSAITASIDTYQGSEYVGGLVGETQNATIRNSVSTGFNLEKTSNTKGGLLGYGANPTIDSSWTFYIAKKRTNFAKNATPNGAYYATVSQSPYGKYILVDEGLINATEASYPTFASLCGFVGLLTNANVEGTLEFDVKVPNKTLDSNYENTQLAFYNASGNDTVTDNVDSFSKFENNNNTLTIALDMASGNSMQICVVGIEFANVAKWNSSNPLYSVTDGATKNVENSYKKPSDSDSYSADVTNNNSGTVASNPTKIYDDEGNLRYIQAIVYFNGVIVGATVENKQQVGQYDSGELTPGSSATTPYTISNQQEWNDFAYSVYTGTDYTNKYVKLLTNDIVINTGNGGMHEGTKGSHNFGSVQAIPSAGQNAPLTDANGNAVDRNNIGYNFAGDISHDGNVNNFHGTFDGNGHYITVEYGSGGFYRVSVFPNAAGATFRNLTIKGYIQAASQMTGANGIANSAAYDVAGFVGKPFGTLKFYNCTNEADIIGLRNVAGLVGYNSGGQSITFEACVNTGDITSLQGSYTLGGYNNSKYNYDDNLDGTGVGITNIGYTFGTGGIIGAYTGTIQIESCRNAGTIIGGHNVGGIIGLHEGTSSSVSTLTINNCANSGEIRSNSGYWGEDEGQIGGDASRGVRQSTFGYAGGLVGKTGRYSILKMYSSYNSGWVVTLSNIAGGLVGSVGTMNQPSGNKNSVLTGGRSVIAYCYNVGKVNSGGTFPKRTKNYEGYGRENFGGAIVGGVAGLVGNIQITQTYNAGEVWQFGIICYGGSWQVRAAGIVGQSQPTSNGYVLFDNVYNVGTVYVRAINTHVLWGAGGELFKDARYGAAISGYCDTTDAAKRIYSFECYSINNCVSSHIAKDISGDNNYLPYKNGTNSWESDEKFDEYYQNGGIAGIGASNADLIETGMVYNTYDSLTAAMNSQSKLYMNGSNFAFSQSNAVFDLNFNSNLGTYTTVAAINSVSANAVTGTTNTNVSAASWARYPDSWLYVYGCLPQLSVFALDTQNGLSMRSIGYGQDQYGEFNENGLPAGSEQYPFIIKDGIDLMGMQALVDTGYSFVGQYIEVANGENNLDGLAATRIKFPTYASTGTAATDGASNTMFKAVDKDGSYKVGKSYHLLLKGAVFNKARNEDATYVGTDYGYWAYNTYYYNGAYNDSDFGDMRRYGIFRIQNFIPMGRGNNVFKGHFSGKQDGDTSTIIDDLRITTGKDGGGYGGLFAKVQDAYIGYISIGGTSKVSAYSYDNSTEAGAGGIVGKALGSTVIENCGVADSVQIGAYGRTYKVTISSDGITFAGGIAGVADPIQGNSYNAGITLTIRNCSVSTSGIIESAKSNIGGVLGYVGGDAGASGKSNTVRIEGCSVDKAVIQAASSANTSSQIGGILGYGSQYVAAFITGCKVGVGGAVSIKGEHSLGGIAGGMSNAKGGYIDSCTVGANTTIERIDVGGDKTVLESENHGTAIGGLVGFTQDSKDDTSPLTTTFSGTSAFNGTITVSVEATNPSTDSDGKISCIGGIVGDMGSGANFASGSNVIVGGNINITLAAANVGGVVGRTNKATFIGKFNVAPNMSTENAENVGGFIGKNIGTVYILADTTDKLENTTVGALNGTEITIGGKIKGTSEVGGFIGVNNSGSTLNIGSNVANAKPYKSGTLEITITASVTGSGDNVGGIVGKNEGVSGQDDYAIVDIVKGTIKQNGAIKGANNVGGIIGLNDGLLTTGGGEADTTIGGVTLSEEQQNEIKNLSINNTGSVTGTGDYVGGVVGKLDSPSALRTEDSGKGAIAGTFTNSGNVSGGKFVGGSLGYVGKNVTITAKNNVATLFVNDGQVTATGYYAGGSIGALVGKIQGENSSVAVKFENKKKVNATGYVGGSIGVLAGPVSYAQFVNSSDGLEIAAVNSVGGSVGYIGVPSLLSDELVGFTAHQIDINNTHFEASGNLKANPSQDAINAAKKDKEDNGWGGVGGAIGVMGAAINSWTDNTYYANGNVSANGIYNVGGIVGLINAGNITISNMLAYRTTVTGGKNVGGIVGATDGIGTVITSAYAIEGTFTGSKNVGGIIGLAKTDTDASTSYWVKGYANSDIATYDVKDLSKLGFTTGKATTGWFFLYANDADGANGLGTINTSHSTNSDLQYWKRIADAYTASEREKGLDKTDLKSNIVYGGGSPQLSTLYATATAAEVNSQYYMYTATSNEAVKPQVEFDDTRNGYFISVKTNDQDAAGNKRQAQNVAVFYRKITKGSDLTYNGYARNAVVGMDGVGLLEQTPDETTVYDETYRNKYFYTTSTSVDGTTATTAMSDPNTYKSTIKIYFFDGKGKARIVGGIDDLEWTIKARELSATFKVATNRKYGEDSNGSEGENKYDMFVSISNIAPNRGKQVPIKLDVSVGNDIVVTFTWDGTVFKPSKAGSGITLSSIGMIPSEAMKDSDTMFIAEEQTDGLNTQVLNCYLVFTEAKAYTVTINTSDVVAKPRYTIKNEEATGNFTVSPAELKLSRTTGGSHAFDNTSVHGAKWTITGFKYEDGFSQLAMFKPVFTADGKSSNMYDSSGMKASISDLNGPIVSISQSQGTNKTITIELSTVRKLGDYYINFEAGKVGENTYRVGNYELSFADGQNEYHIVKTTINISSNLTSANNKKVYNQKTSVITVTFIASAADDPSFSGISNFEEFLTRFFAVKDTAKFSKVDIPTSSNDVKKTVTWTFTTKADAGSYVIELIEGKDHVAEEANCAHVPDKLPTYTYTINRRPITLSATKTPLPTGKTNYVYNTKHQGIGEVFVNQGSQSNEIGLLSGDTIKISVRINGSTESTLTFNDKYSKAAGVSTINANTYTASFSLSGNNNYTLSSSSLSWTIEQYVVKVGAFSLGSGKTYDGTAVTPTITIVGISGSNGTYTYENDTFTLTYSIEKDGGSAYESGKLVNAGTYKIKVGGTNGKIVARRAKGTSVGSDTSNNYKFDSSNSTADYTINACPIAIEWNYPTLVYTGNNQNITIKSITVNGTAIAMTSNSVRSGLGNDVLTFTLSGGGVNAGSYTTKAELSSVSGTNEGVDSVVGNYTPKLFTSDPFTIVKSKVGIRYNGGTANKVYDANENVKDNNFTFAVYSTNFGASGNDDLFSIKMLYDNKNVSNGYTKTINFAYTFKATNTNYELDASTATSQAVPNVGQITPAHIRVALDKLRSGKATRTYTDDEFYGGADGATGNGRSKTYRTGEGFTVSGVRGSDNINVVARYQEADNTRDGSGTYFNFSKYVNDVYKNADGTFKKASTPTYFKKLVFTMTGTDAANYTFNVYDSSAEGGNKYSESDSTAAAIQSVTVYDSRDSKNNKNASGAASIQIEITVKSVRVEYSDTAQSYANDDNTYNTDWKPITGTNKDMDKADAKIKVSNGWMYADGKDHTAEEGYTKREYRGYTTIRGSQNSERLGATVDPTNGMDLNYRLSNQPTLTIAYFVSTGDEYEINSLARLLIASFYYTASQNPGNLEIIKIVSSGYKWVSVVSADDYDKGEFKLPQDTPITDSKATTWDEYFTELEAKGYSVFLNIEANAQDNIPANTWGYYATTTSESSTIPTSYKLTKDIAGKFTESDISILNTFFTVIGADGKTTTSTWSGNGTYLKNVLKAAEGKIATINGSLFVSTAKAEGATAITGFDGTFDGNGYVIEYLNIMGYGKDNVGLFDIIGANGIVKNLHLRNVTINGNAKYVGGIAGKVLAAADALTEKSVKNVSFHGSINVTGLTDQSVGGLFGISERAVENAIVLGSITVSNENAKVGGVVGSSEQGMSNVVSLMQIDANCNVGAFSQTNTNVTNSYHLQNAVWRRNGSSITFVNHANAKTYDELMLGSNSLYSNGTSASVLGTYDVIDETFADSGQNANPRQSKRLRDMVSVYLLMYSLSVNNGKYTISSSSWLVGTADGTTAKPIAIANKQNVSLLRELRFASFTLKANVSIEIASTFSGAFYGSVNAGAYKITCDKAMFEAYTNDAPAWLSVQQ